MCWIIRHFFLAFISVESVHECPNSSSFQSPLFARLADQNPSSLIPHLHNYSHLLLLSRAQLVLRLFRSIRRFSHQPNVFHMTAVPSGSAPTHTFEAAENKNPIVTSMKALDTSTLALCRSLDSARDPDMSIKIEVRLFIALMAVCAALPRLRLTCFPCHSVPLAACTLSPSL